MKIRRPLDLFWPVAAAAFLAGVAWGWAMPHIGFAPSHLVWY